MRKSSASVLMALALIIPPFSAHSWVEQMMVIASNGSFTGSPGYARNNTMRNTPGFSDLLMVHILPGQGQPSIEERQAAPSSSISAPAAGTSTTFSDTMSILPTDPMCKKTQQTQFQANGSPRLQAAPGAFVALRYQENGHVSLPQNQPGKPANRGTVYIYGTTQPKEDEIFLDVFKQWNAAGTGGDRRGVLLATQPFDDERCYQVNSGNISTARQAQFPHQADQLMGANLWCQNDITLPANLPSGQPYTLYWVWDWPTVPGVDPNLPNGKAEIYTTCIDVDIQGSNATEARRDLGARQAPAAPAASEPDLNNVAIPSYISQHTTPSAQSAQAAQATPASPATQATQATQAPQLTSASPMAPTNAGQSATDARAASKFVFYLSSCLAASEAPVTVTVTPPAVTVYITPGMSPTTMATMVSSTSILALTDSLTTSTIYMTATSVQGGSQVAFPAPTPVVSSSAQAPAQSQPTVLPNTTESKTSSIYMASTPIQRGSSVASPAPSPVASSPAQVAAQSQPVTYSTTSLPPSMPPTVLDLAPPVTSGTPPPLTPVTSVNSAAVAATTLASGAATPSVALNVANELSFTGTASAIPTTPTSSLFSSYSGTAGAIPIAPTGSLSHSYQNNTSNSTALRSCSMNACKLKKRSLLLNNHNHRH